MKSFSKWFIAVAACVMLAGTAAAADGISTGKVKTINAENKTFVLTDAVGKDHTYHFGDKLIVNRAGTESKSDLKVGDEVNLFHDNGTFTWTTNYILIQEGKNKNCTLVSGVVKSYDPAKKQFDFTGEDAKNWAFSMGTARVQLNGAPSRMEDVKIGDHALIIVDTVGTAATLREVMVDRKVTN